ncbi:chitinase [Dysgonomonas sp. PFB1-18]|uniref:glycoside hydrolase family 18 protein n=1 Tax=unclassified Dysgonomonas TaxID=2630389 RepID=UPI002476988E|nr:MULTISPECIES: glycoside hydrolase family 18 protein [unclassified Dysgonomonas]MDH6307283.1 chitinase [Dysgonomonas sp. PF1-14]MDH6337201.1 chitinase [Dysgonomonas sp. PF1-16]MDH6379125.1 chitinase [Dysgonomonas sp. PFB1-18]MDH6396238.1 chitinase [Dysgonomonas sp. PF1-23]
MKNILILVALLSVILSSCGGTKKEEEKSSKPVIIAYVGGYNGLVDADKIAANKITHINYAFVDVQGGKAFLTNEATDTVNFRKLNELKQQNPDLKILISVGGWSWSRNFSDAVLTPEGQNTFAKSAVDIMKKYDLDGVDIDWEYPAIPGDDGNVYRPEDKQNYTLMFAAIKAELDALSKETNKKYLLTTAVGGQQEFIDNTEMAKVQEYLDYVNVMTYDSQSKEKAIHHTNLDPSDKYENSSSASKSMQAYIAAGVPADKLVMGIAFYGRIYQLKKGWNKGLGDAVDKQIQGKGFTVIRDSLVNQNEYFRYWDDAAKAPYLFNFYKGIFVTYDDEESVKAKCRYVRDNGMAGVMFWEYSSDPKGFLLNAIDQTLK